MKDLKQLEREMLEKAAEIEERGPSTNRWGWDPEEWWQAREQRRQEREQQRATAAERRRRKDRVYFGGELFGVKPSQASAKTNIVRLHKHDLPVLDSEQELADWLGISLGRLRWFTHDKPVDAIWHYVRFTIPKRRGGERTIMAPKVELKSLQRKILYEILERVSVTEHAHGFLRGHSIVTNAAAHTGQEVVLNIDLKDFFPTISYPRVRGLFISIGYGYGVASALALLCTGRERIPFERDDTSYYVSVGERGLVQGAPTSPAISNLIARRLDRRLAGLAAKHGFVYTRYADDLTFSGKGVDAALRILDASGYIIDEEGFTLHPDKTKLYRQSTRQIVTGLVVNEKVSVPRDLRRRVRAILHQAQYTGLEAQNTQGRPHFRAYLQGLIAFINEANPETAKKLRHQLEMVAD